MGKRILTVDDEFGIRRLVQLNLGRAGHSVSTATDGVEALRLIEADPPDLVILDITMPNMDGIETLRRLKADPKTAPIKVILLTARSRDEDVFEGQRSGADLYLTKPFSPQALVEAVEAVFAPDAAE
ncbi:MAG: response regulator [Armatimonadetes bacterium]|nr:response regulator [Armatimonadota bacterium]MBM3947435.1 response regulator [SAR202 cluster bacterium]